MIDIIIITHGNLAEALNNSVENILDISKKVIPVCLEFDLDHKACTEKIKSVLSDLGETNKKIILTDLFGGTPSNITIPFIKEGNTEVITGVNLPMLLFLLSQKKKKSFEELCNGAKKAGKDAIFIAGKLIGKE